MKDLKTAFQEKYPDRTIVLSFFEDSNDCKAEWGNITKLSLARFVDYMSERIAKSSIKTYAAMMKAVLTLYSDEVELPKDYAKILTVRGDISQNAWLNDSEIERLITYNPANDTERLVRNQFVLGCVTGARHSDYLKFTKENIQGERLVYVSQKTHVKAEVPLSPVVIRLLNERSDEIFTDSKKEVSDPTFNSTIRKICRICGITERVKLFKAGEDVEGEKCEFISSHTARRSFATNVYLRCKDIFLVSRYLGHQSVEMSAKYVCSIGDAPKEVLEYFNRFK